AAGAAELGAGVLLALGLLTPLAAALVTAVMIVAIATVHLSKGIWTADGGFELNLVYIAIVFALAGVGSGTWSLDHALGLDDAGRRPERVGDGLVGGQGQGRPQLAVDFGHEHVPGREPAAVERREAHELVAVVRVGAADRDLVRHRGRHQRVTFMLEQCTHYLPSRCLCATMSWPYVEANDLQTSVNVIQ